MANYRGLYSPGWQVVFFNATLEDEVLHCGLAFFGANLPALPLQLIDIDTQQKICTVTPPEDMCELNSHIWFHSPLDDLEIEISYEAQPISAVREKD